MFNNFGAKLLASQVPPYDLKTHNKLQEQFAQRSCPQGKPQDMVYESSL